MIQRLAARRIGERVNHRVPEKIPRFSSPRFALRLRQLRQFLVRRIGFNQQSVARNLPEGFALTHVDATGAARMVDVSEKESTSRTALATGVLQTTTQVIDLLRQNGLPKGDALATARVAGIMAAKRTPDLIPLCHPIAITGVAVELSLQPAEVRISATVRTTDRTGVEMEALTAVAVAGLTLHDMIKAVDPAAVLGEIRVERKDGGKTGSWIRPDGAVPS